ncbi:MULTISPECIES: hypothetical protein [unclassified Arcicella]|uniref:hypothetical protein n=1 Tax=unclassified Arcicella TaxID=2644986 RepID=UPI0028577347|nr:MULTISPECIES: hypothetical protein [unclassified Arcicella]MDR6564861.1 hypothetical protein [Arcicella sp. BE51]MDR6814628.1 hypothetical protein [Arcicella sp. BE140]MDR6826074.1 hypothetical protein [Arcicella sp. BE139]
MSSLFLYIQLRNSQLNIKYTNTFVDFVKLSKPSVMVYDIDNFSDNLTIQYAIKLVKESPKILVFLDTEEGSSIKQLMSLLTNLLDKSESIKVLINGENERLEKMIGILDYQKIRENTQGIALLESILREFL